MAEAPRDEAGRRCRSATSGPQARLRARSEAEESLRARTRPPALEAKQKDSTRLGLIEAVELAMP